MRSSSAICTCRRYIAAAICFVFFLSIVCAQQSKTQTPSQQPVVIRINTELIQSPVIVLDKQGHFVDALNRDQFELSIDGHPRAISFFERITAGTSKEAEKYQPTTQSSATPATVSRKISSLGRTLVFFIDDLHLSTESINRTRTALLHYIDRSMGQNDRALVTTTTGQIGFLQQLTDNKQVLQAAIERIKYRQLFVPDDARPPMSPYQALNIEAGDSRVLNYFADMLVKDQFSKLGAQAAVTTPGQAIAQAEARGDNQRRQAEMVVKNRAKNILQQYSTISASTLGVLKNFLNSLDQLPGSKVVLFISDGFFLNSQIAGELQKLNEITSNALRSGAIVYSVQASGLGTSYTDASKEVRLGPRMDTGGPGVGEDVALQAPLHTVAVDSGGRPFFNSNSMDGSIQQALHETSEYYLLAWRPEPNERRSDEFRRIQFAIKGHPELSVRAQKGYFLPKAAATERSVKTASTDDAQTNSPNVVAEKIREALSSLYPVPDLPISINASFLDVPNQGPQLTVATEVSVTRLTNEPSSEKQTGIVDLVGVLLNDEGKTVSSFGGQLKFNVDATKSASEQTVSRADSIKVKPGIYQVRVAARDEKGGLTGSAADWIVVPDLSTARITLSSLLIGDARNLAVSNSQATSDQRARLSVSHHFARSSRLRFLTYIYNASRGLDGKGAPDLTLQMRVMRDDQAVSTSQPLRIPTEAVDDLARIPYAAEISLGMLTPGRYLLLLSAIDNITKASATQGVKFVVE